MNISDNDKFTIFYIMIMYAGDMISIIKFSMVSKLSQNMINKHFKQFIEDYVHNKSEFFDFHDPLSIPINVWYKLLDKIKLDYCEYVHHYNSKRSEEYLTTTNIHNKINNNNKFWPVARMQVYHKTHMFDNILNMQELSVLGLNFAIPHANYLDNIKSCNKLTRLNLDNCSLEQFPLAICDLINLKELTIIKFHFVRIPDNINKLIKLEMLTLSHNIALTKFPHTICKIKSLKHFMLTHCNIKKVPNNIYELQNLEYLSLSNNNIETLPNSVIKMHKLKTILLDHNIFTSFPTIFQQLVLTPDICINMKQNHFVHISSKHVFTMYKFIDKMLASDFTNIIVSWIVIRIQFCWCVNNFLVNPFIFNDGDVRRFVTQNFNSDKFNSDKFNIYLTNCKHVIATWES